MWAGGDARSRCPSLGKEYTEDPECYTSGLEEACHSDNLDVLRKLKPDPSRDNLSELLLLVTPHKSGAATINSVPIAVNNNSGSFNWARSHQYLGKEIETLAVDGRACGLIHLKSSDFGYGQQAPAQTEPPTAHE